MRLKRQALKKPQSDIAPPIFSLYFVRPVTTFSDRILIEMHFLSLFLGGCAPSALHTKPKQVTRFSFELVYLFLALLD